MSYEDENDTMNGSVQDDDPDSTFNILLATDIHLGFMEKHPVRGEDSFVTFEEILKYGVEKNADCILLGGDLFHENKPSRKSLQRCMDLLRKYCLGPKDINFQCLSEPGVIFKDCATPGVNFEDPNLHISLPIFSIHGNHDDPCGEGNYSVMDMLAASGFVNYFGKVPNLENLSFIPILLRKNDINVAIYGIGSMNDDRLFRLFQEEKVTFQIPEPSEIDTDDLFSILVLHQNRARHGCKSYAGEHLLPSFVDLVFWGHEHECRIEPEDSLDQFRITQPGSSVATSLSPGEAVPKHIGMLRVRGSEDFYIEKFPLLTTRPFVFDTLSLDEFSDIGYQFGSDEVIEKIKMKIKDMLQIAETLLSGHPKQPKEPLLRLRIEHESDQDFNTNNRDLNIMLQLEDRVANPDDVVKLMRKKAASDKIKSEIDEDAMDSIFSMGESVNMVEGHLEKLLIEYFQESNKKPLMVMHERTLAEAVHYYVDKSHDDAFHDIIFLQAKKIQEELKDKVVPTDRVAFRELFAEIREQRNANPQQITDEAKSWLSGDLVVPKNENPAPLGGFDDPMLVANEPATPPAARGRGRGQRRARAAAGTGTRARGRGRQAAAAAPVAEEEPEIMEVSGSDDEFLPPTNPKQATPRQPAARATRGTARAGTAAAATPIAQAFARQSQSQQAPTQRSQQSGAPPKRAAASRGVCYVSDSD